LDQGEQTHELIQRADISRNDREFVCAGSGKEISRSGHLPQKMNGENTRKNKSKTYQRREPSKQHSDIFMNGLQYAQRALGLALFVIVIIFASTAIGVRTGGAP
jgi:hypothetical protein